jgi:hypothetical protein
VFQMVRNADNRIYIRERMRLLVALEPRHAM